MGLGFIFGKGKSFCFVAEILFFFSIIFFFVKWVDGELAKGLVFLLIQEKLVVDNGENSAASKEVKSSVFDSSSSSSSVFPESPNKDINRRVAAVTVIAALSLFVSKRLDFGISLKDLTASALPYEEALSNGKPTVVDFYADWCEVCRELAPDVYKIDQQYNLILCWFNGFGNLFRIGLAK